MTSTVKLDETGKEHLEKLQARLRLTSNLKIDQFRLLRSLIFYGEENFDDFLSYLQGTALSDDEIRNIKQDVIGAYSYHFPGKSDDELLYEE